MTVGNLGPAVNEPCFQERLDSLRASYADHDDLVRELERFVQKAPDDQIRNNLVERLYITQRDGRPAEKMQTVAPGSLTYNLTNASPARIIAAAMSISAAECRAYSGTTPGVKLGGFLSGSRLLSTQTFLDLFASETVMSAGGLAVKRVAVLFTDIEGSTALYDRAGT
jgi:hypothetical protein